MNSSNSPIDILVVGAGIIGLATARALLIRYPKLRVTVLDKEPKIAQHQTGRNSGVIHTGLYYKPGSLKAKLCVAGSAAMTRYCDEHDIPYRRCGKVVVATEASELPRLQTLFDRGQANGVMGLEMIGPERLKEIEPHAAGLKAVYSPHTGIVDYRVVADSYAADIAHADGRVLTGQEVSAIERRGNGVRVSTQTDVFEAKYVIVCGGVYADRLAALSGGPRDPRIVPFRGDYFVLSESQRHLTKGLIYPVPDPTFPFLGVHSTLRMDGSVWLGPNAVLAYAREGYRRTDVRLGDLWETLRTPGFQRLAAKHWRAGLGEMIRDASKRLFVRAMQRYVPEITDEGVEPGPAGIRAQAVRPDGTLEDDFVFNHDGPIIHVRNAPSPGATSSLPIGENIATLAGKTFGLAG